MNKQKTDIAGKIHVVFIKDTDCASLEIEIEKGALSGKCNADIAKNIVCFESSFLSCFINLPLLRKDPPESSLYHRFLNFSEFRLPLFNMRSEVRIKYEISKGTESGYNDGLEIFKITGNCVKDKKITFIFKTAQEYNNHVRLLQNEFNKWKDYPKEKMWWS